MSDDSEASPLEGLHRAVQEFSNSLSDSVDEVSVVTAALVVWEERSYDEVDDAIGTAVHYAVTGDAANSTLALGLSVHGAEMLKRDLFARCSHDD